ncbi:hypothetical protein Y032_0006g3013 [Ancylostoma ceylanicum]|uniref:Armadillo repeat-containing domain-containing protein n=2 Tax=Ancylostoma ceylanicum TaxID=53326 RepID=A0A016VPM4_9BILA|nr:hypothetical protein Y032_0006g3013 [Ancylostoma ceylanicum]
MGQQHSGFVVEIASPRLGRFQAVPQKDPDEENEPSWRITVNPSAELFGSQRLRQLIDRLYHQQKLLSATDAKQCSPSGDYFNAHLRVQLPTTSRASISTSAGFIGLIGWRRVVDWQERPSNVDLFQVLSALQAIDPSSDLLLPLLTVLSNATAYPANQILMRELRITERVAEMICSPRHGWSRSCRVMLLQCLANMAVCPENHGIVRCAIPHAVQRLTSNDEMEVVVALQALTNLSLNISTEQIPQFVPAIPHCLSRLWIRGEPNINALRLLVNLSCCPDMVPYMLGSKAVSGLLRLLDTDREEVLLRAITWLLCTSSAVDALHLTYDRIACHNQDPFRNPAHTLYHSIYGPKSREELEQRARELTLHTNADVVNKATRLLEILKNIPPFPTLGSQLNRL